MVAWILLIMMFWSIKTKCSVATQNRRSVPAKSRQLTAGTGTAYQWTPAAGLDNVTIATPLASPLKTTTYTVKVTNGFGCSNSDLTVIVAGPFTVKARILVCTGGSMQLNASGANSYQWIGNTAGLSNTQIADPVVNIQAETSYTVVGYDVYGCFTDTANVFMCRSHPFLR